MSNPLKAIGKAIKSVAKAVKKVFKSDIFKAVALGAGMFFGIPAAATALGVGAGAAGGAAAGAGAGGWWSSTLGIGAGGAATTAATGAASGFPASIAGMTPMASTVAKPAAVGLMGSAPAMTGSLGQTAATGFSAAAGAGASAGTNAGSTFGGALKDAGGTILQEGGKQVAKEGGGLIGAFGRLDPMVQSSILQMGGNAVSNWGAAKQKEEEQQRLWDREDELKDRESAWGVRYDGERPLPDYNPGEMLNQLAQGYSPSYGNFLGVNPGQKKKAEGEEIFAHYNPYWS